MKRASSLRGKSSTRADSREGAASEQLLRERDTQGRAQFLDAPVQPRTVVLLRAPAGAGKTTLIMARLQWQSVLQQPRHRHRHLVVALNTAAVAHFRASAARVADVGTANEVYLPLGTARVAEAAAARTPLHVRPRVTALTTHAWAIQTADMLDVRRPLAIVGGEYTVLRSAFCRFCESVLPALACRGADVAHTVSLYPELLQRVRAHFKTTARLQPAPLSHVSDAVPAWLASLPTAAFPVFGTAVTTAAFRVFWRALDHEVLGVSPDAADAFQLPPGCVAAVRPRPPSRAQCADVAFAWLGRMHWDEFGNAAAYWAAQELMHGEPRAYRRLPRFHCVVIDEAQDTSPVFLEIARGYWLRGCQLVLVGDVRQAVNQFANNVCALTQEQLAAYGFSVSASNCTAIDLCATWRSPAQSFRL